MKAVIKNVIKKLKKESQIFQSQPAIVFPPPPTPTSPDFKLPYLAHCPEQLMQVHVLGACRM